MKANIIPGEPGLKSTQKQSWQIDIVRRAVIKRLSNIEHGQIIFHENNRRLVFGRRTDKCDLSVNLTIKNPHFFSKIAFGGSIAAGETYIQGYWTCDDLTGLVRIMVLNRSSLLALEKGIAHLSKPFNLLLHYLRRNSRAGSKKNIQAHYDIGNDLFSLFLDESMMYSSAIYPHENCSLEEASLYKIDLICKKLNLGPNDHLLEIGTGWGALAIHASEKYGCRVTSATISDEQFNLAQERVNKAGLQNKIEIIKCDYRDLEGHYDKLVSVEMLEAVGHEYFDLFFKKCCELLKPDGLMLLQTITIADQHYSYARRSVDFIQRYIFPGGCLPSVSVLSDCIARVTDFHLLHLADYSEHYARTLRDWRQRFLANVNKVRELQYPESFIRLWEYYLCYCEGGFSEKSIGLAQIVLGKPLNRDNPASLSL
ncbi:MAG: class I SAM-dependent methyltransferase [Gammaproteobacteria bacterium]|nr:class I SAM-dependent methyltransferase [Gammaproteobacteria bacterium]